MSAAKCVIVKNFWNPDPHNYFGWMNAVLLAVMKGSYFLQKENRDFLLQNLPVFVATFCFKFGFEFNSMVLPLRRRWEIVFLSKHHLGPKLSPKQIGR